MLGLNAVTVHRRGILGCKALGCLHILFSQAASLLSICFWSTDCGGMMCMYYAIARHARFAVCQEAMCVTHGRCPAGDLEYVR